MRLSFRCNSWCPILSAPGFRHAVFACRVGSEGWDVTNIDTPRASEHPFPG